MRRSTFLYPFLLINFLLAISGATAQELSYLYELEYSPRPAPRVGKPGCWIYSTFLEAVPNPHDSTESVLRVDDAAFFYDLYTDCPEASSGETQQECPMETLDVFLPQVPDTAEMSQFEHMTVRDGYAVCDPGYACGGIEVNVDDGSGGTAKTLAMGCVPLEVDGCEFPKEIIDGVCQYPYCPGGCAEGEKCSMRVYSATVDVPDPDAGWDTEHTQDITFFCEPEENLDPPNDGIVEPGQFPVTYPPGGGSKPIPPVSCPPQCPTASQGCVSPGNAAARVASPAAAFAQDRFCDSGIVPPQPGECIHNGLVLPQIRCPGGIDDIIKQPIGTRDEAKACPDPCNGKTPCAVPMFETKGPESFQKPTDENGCPCPPVIVKIQPAAPADNPCAPDPWKRSRTSSSGSAGGNGLGIRATGTSWRKSLPCTPPQSIKKLPDPNDACASGNGGHSSWKRLPVKLDSMGFKGFYNSGNLPGQSGPTRRRPRKQPPRMMPFGPRLPNPFLAPPQFPESGPGNGDSSGGGSNSGDSSGDGANAPKAF